MNKKIMLYAIVIFLNALLLISCDYIYQGPLSYKEGNIIQNKDFSLEYTSIEYQEEVAVINLKLEKKTDSDVILNNVIANAHIYEDWSKTENCFPLSIYFNDVLQKGVENILISNNITSIKIVFPIIVKNGDFDLKISGKTYNLWIKTKDYLEGKESTRLD